MGFHLNAEPWAEKDLPTDREEILDAGHQIASDVLQNWKRGKLYSFKNPNGQDFQVQTFHTYHGPEYWLSRLSKHTIDETLYEKIVYYLNGSERTETGEWIMPDRTRRSRLEKEYIEVLSDCEILKLTDSGWTLVNLEYNLGKPLSIRDFSEWVYPIAPYIDNTGLEVSIVVSLNAQVPMKQSSVEKNHTAAYYASVERLSYDRNTKQLEWLMCTTSDAGGNVPKWIQNATIAKTVAKDVPFLFNFLNTKQT
ncbi:hypothetical protein HG537_0B02020 [Torulaspora globosa]|uniref:DUF3074 domain-containing protein n=1 Tax=Torulaspora globosa TaxID=48254 RepID=A0A7H9HM40_9SACH|nr:hypothetical protein HG537_0B02020 [Torulaspora sp. CBS 2947]